MFLAQDLLGHELAQTDHLVAVAGVGDQVAVLFHQIKNGKVVRAEGTQTAGRLFLVVSVFVLIPLLAMGKGGCPHVSEIRPGDELRGIDAVGVHLHLVLFHRMRHGTPLNAPEVEIRFVIDTPHLVGNQGSVLTGTERGIGVHMDNRRHLPTVVHSEHRLHTQRAFLEAQVGPHLHVRVDVSIPVLDVDPVRQTQHIPCLIDPGPHTQHHKIPEQWPPVGFNTCHRSVAAQEAHQANTAENPHTLGLCLVRKPVERPRVVCVSPPLLVENGRNVFRLPVFKDRFLHVVQAVLLSFDQLGIIPDILLATVDLCHILVHVLRGYLHVSHRQISVAFRILFPNIHAVGDQFLHGRLIVIVADDPAGDPGSPGTHRGFIEYQDILSRTPSLLPQLLSQVIGGAQPVHAGTDDDVFGMCRKTHFPSFRY